MEHPIRLYRRRLDLTLDALAKRVGVSTSTLSRVETGALMPSSDFVRRIHDATGGEITPNDLLLPPSPTEGTPA